MNANNLKKENNYFSENIAIIGMAGRFSNAENISDFWNIIKDGRSCVKKFPDNRKKDFENFIRLKENLFPDNPSLPSLDTIVYYNGSYLDEISHFDYTFFNITPAQARLMDPHQRLLLETSYHAFEDAGYSIEKLAGSKTGIYIGFEPNIISSYANIIAAYDPDLFQNAIVGNSTSMMTARISYFFNLKGPAISINTGCSSSLVALHAACKGLHNGDCELAIVGGVKVFFNMVKRNERRIGIESDDGKTKAFDAESDGTGFGEGVGVVVLKSLKNALKDKDNIHAVIKGSAINQDGRTANITAPNMLSQIDVLCKAWENAQIDPSTLSYIETHGTGTPIGDPIEIEAIQRAFRKYTNENNFCAIGAVKNNLGHLLDASGMASLIKLIMCIKNGIIPPVINFNKLNPNIDLENSPVYIDNSLQKWNKSLKRCGLSAFGFSGTNAHIVLEEAPSTKVKKKQFMSKLRIFTVSAKTKSALQNYIKKYFNFCNQNNNTDENDLCYTVNTGRNHFKFRITIILENYERLKDKLLYLLSNIDKDLSDHNIYNNFSFIENIENNKNTNTNNNQITLIKKFLKSKGSDKNILKKITNIYLSGTDILWEKIYEDVDVKKISLPFYPFERKRCWLDLTKKLNNKKIIEDNNLFYRTIWQKEKSNFSGGIGLEIAKYLSTQNNVNIVLISRTQFQNYAKWSQIIKEGTNTKLIYKIKTIQQIENSGSKIIFQNFDISNYTQLNVMINKLKMEYSKINGIIHCAGIPGGNIILKSTEETFKNIFASKVMGTYFLHEILKKDKIDFFIFCSSIASVYGFIGQAEYAAANAYLDSFAFYLNSLGKKALTINWVAWKEKGMAVDTGYNIDTIFKAIKNKEAIEAMHIALNKQINRLIIGELNYAGGRVHVLEKEAIKLSDSIIDKIKKISGNDNYIKPGMLENDNIENVDPIVLTGRETGEYSETEQLIGQIWGDIFGYDKIDINADFFELGGDSILALTIISKVNKKFRIEIEITEILNLLTINELAKYIDAKCQME